MAQPAIRRFNHIVRRLNLARAELKRDQKDIKADRKELAHDRGVLVTLRTGKTTELSRIETERQAAIDTFDPADPALAVRLAELATEQQTVTDSFDQRIGGRQLEIARDVRVVAHDVKELKGDRSLIKFRLHRARTHLQAAEVQADTLKGTNRMRHAVGLKSIDHLVGSTATVEGCARLLLASKNVTFWPDLSTGSDRANVQRLAHGQRALVEASNTSIRTAMPKLKMMQALVEMSRRGPIQINAITGGNHSPNSNHYRGTAVDLHTSNAKMIVDVADDFGGHRNNESNHIHLDF